MHKRNKEKEFCLICFKQLDEVSFSFLLFDRKIICNECKNKLKKIESKTSILGVETTFLYEYNSFFKSLLYQYKGCYDIELSKIFLSEYKDKINKAYKKYIVIYPPSFSKDNIQRGFKHIEEIVKELKLKSLDIFKKTSNYKQANSPFKDRKNISNFISINSKVDISKKYLIIDDVYTSGQTLKTLIKLLVNKGVIKENIKAIIISKTSDFVEL